jgi:hypothetical protein
MGKQQDQHDRPSMEMDSVDQAEESASTPPSWTQLQQENDALREEIATLRARLAPADAERGSDDQEEVSAREQLRYRTLFDNTSDAVFAYHLSPAGTPGRFIEVNRVACERYGYRREELLRMRPADVADPSAMNLAGKLQELRQKGQFVTESVHRTKDGQHIVAEVSAHLFTMNGQPTVLSICRDITARAQPEKQLREQKAALEDSMARQKAMLNSALDCIITMDDKGRITEFNAAAEVTFGYKREEVVGRSLADAIVPPRLRMAHARGMQRFLKSGQSKLLGRRIEMPALHASGREIPVELTITCTWQGGRQPFFTGYLRDITEHKQAEQERAKLLERERAARAAAEASEERMAFLAEASVTLASSLDYEMTLQRVADLAVPHLADWCAVTMFVPEAATEEAPGEAFKQVAVAHVDPEKVAWARELRRRYPPDPEAPVGAPHVIRTGEPACYRKVQEEQVRAAARNEEHRTLLERVGFRSVLIVPMKVRGEAIGAITLVWSESEKDYTDSDLRLAEELARRAALEIHNARLFRKLQKLYGEAKEARHEAEEMNRLKSAFLANMSHEVRTPLTCMIGFASILTKRLSGEEHEFARRLLNGGQRLMNTLEAVLALSRLEAGQAGLQPAFVCVAEEARETLALMERQAHQKDLTLELRVFPGAEVASACLDRGALNSILQNLVGNAIKFTDRGEITVTVYEEAQRVYLAVEDTGRGIDDAFLPHLFKPFQQESKGWDRSHEGAGLGLALSKQLVEIIGGRIDVQTKKEVGSRFTVSFPLAAAASDDQSAPGAAPAPRNERQLRQSTPQMLIVEDNEDTQFLMQALLSELGDVRAVATAEEAIREAHRRSQPSSEEQGDIPPAPFDLCLVDINLGSGKSGTDLLKELRAMPSYRDTPLVVVTGYALPGDRERLLEMGFDAYVSKPFDPETLLDLSVRLLSR